MPKLDSLVPPAAQSRSPHPSCYVDAIPYRWPWNGDLRPQNTVFLVIDMQTDFCGKGGSRAFLTAVSALSDPS